MTRWSVQIEARFASVWPKAFEDAVAERLDRAGLLEFGDRSNGVEGDPGPTLIASLVLEAADEEEAAATGWDAYRTALDAAGAEGYAHQRTYTRPKAAIDRELEEHRTLMDEWRARAAAGDESPLRDSLIIGTDRRRTERP